MSAQAPILLEFDGNIARLTFNRPHRRNAIDLHTMDVLDKALQTLEKRQTQPESLRCVIVTGMGEQAFVAGGDLKDLHTLQSHEDALSMQRQMSLLLRRLEGLHCPVLMAINAVAVGGGMEIALAGDQRFVAAEATLQFRQVHLGLICGWGGMTRLERLVGKSKAFHILLRETVMTPERALALGVVDGVVPRAELLPHVEAVARSLADLPVLAVQAIKRGLLAIPEQPFEQALAYEAELFARCWSSPAHWNAVAGFQANRGKGGSHESA